MKGKKTVLIILDGWGHGDQTKSDVIYNASTPFIDSLYKKYPNSELLTDGEHVGLPKGQMGNSEVGHLNIGAGRIVDQELVKINKACEEGTIRNTQALQEAFHYVKENNKKLHFIGLVSNGGIHSHQNHLYKLCELANEYALEQVFIHAFTDGRDCDPRSGLGFIKQLKKKMFKATIASVCGRYYAMDRDKRWKRVKLAYDMIVKGIGHKTTNIIDSIQASYNNDITDEFIKPIIYTDNNGNSIGNIENGDAVICFNFRTDRCREITIALTQNDIIDFGMKKLDLHYTTMTNYDETFKGIKVIYNKSNIKNTLGEILERSNCTQLRIAETEKYPHVTFFFSGGREKEFDREKRIMIPSPSVATYDLKPEMSAREITKSVIQEIDNQSLDFICLNFANPDMVGHTGNYQAITQAVETVDSCTKNVVECGLKNDYAIIIIADHGNADYALNKDQTPNTSHSNNPVPCFVLGTHFNKIDNGILADVAPTILEIMEIKIPKEMKGKILVK